MRGHGGGVFAVGADVDDRIGGVVVDVGDRGEREMDADGAALERGDAPHLVGAMLSLPVAATPILGGSGVPPLKRIVVPPSRSEAIRSGTAERSCRRLSLAAMSSGDPTETIRPPTWSESTHDLHPGEGFGVVGRVGAGNPGNDQLCDPVSQREDRASASSPRSAAGRPPDGTAAGCGVGGATADPPQAQSRTLTSRGTWRAQVSCPAAGYLWVPLGYAGPGSRREPGARSAQQAVRPGSRCCSADSAHLVRDRRVGLVTNQSGIDASGVSDVVRLRAAGVRLVALFSPEHGFRGAADPGPLSRHRKIRPLGFQSTVFTAGVLPPPTRCSQGIDMMLVDLQDAGARYYTYIATTIEVMKAAAAGHCRCVILDRPNPIGGAVQGNVLEDAHFSPVGRLRRAHATRAHARGDGPPRAGGPRDRGWICGWCRSQGGAGAWHWTRRVFPFIPPSPNLQDAGKPLSLSGHLPLRGHQPVGRTGVRCAVRAGRARHGSTPRQCSRRCARPRCRACARGASSFTPRAPGDGKYADTSWPGSGWRSPTARRTTRPSPRSTF